MPMPFRGHSISPARNGADKRLCDQAEATANLIGAKSGETPPPPTIKTGIIVVASAWLAFYVAAVIHLL